jgi:hypothetical protein
VFQAELCRSSLAQPESREIHGHISFSHNSGHCPSLTLAPALLQAFQYKQTLATAVHPTDINDFYDKEIWKFERRTDKQKAEQERS